jgi:hypothetical protein
MIIAVCTEIRVDCVRIGRFCFLFCFFFVLFVLVHQYGGARTGKNQVYSDNSCDPSYNHPLTSHYGVPVCASGWSNVSVLVSVVLRCVVMVITRVVPLRFESCTYDWLRKSCLY